MEKKYIHRGDPATVDKILRKTLAFSRRFVIKLKQSNGILVNGTSVHTNHIVKNGDTVTVCLPTEAPTAIEPQSGALAVLYEDDMLLAVNKPRGMAVHPTLTHKSGTLANRVLYYYQNTPFVFRPVNRLDKDTTGIVLIAKNQIAAANLAKQLQNNAVQKHYMAVVVGVPPQSGTICASIARCADSIIKRCVVENGKEAKTNFKLVKTDAAKNLSLVSAQPVTGRTHQIRVHFAHIGTPLFGDFLYGEEVENTPFFLHCTRMTFLHPETQKEIALSCAPPQDFPLLP